jgi:hypothetical protein
MVTVTLGGKTYNVTVSSTGDPLILNVSATETVSNKTYSVLYNKNNGLPSLKASFVKAVQDEAARQLAIDTLENQIKTALEA